MKRVASYIAAAFAYCAVTGQARGYMTPITVLGDLLVVGMFAVITEFLVRME